MTQTTLYKENSFRNELKGLKRGIGLGLLIALFFVGLFLFPSEVLGEAKENFDSYEANYNIDDEDDWTYIYGDHLQTKTAQYQSSPHSLRGADTSGSWNTTWAVGEDILELSFSYYQVSNSSDKTTIYFNDGVSLVGIVEFEEGTGLIYAGNAGDISMGTQDYGSWHTITCEFTVDQLRCKEDGEFGIWTNHSNDLPDNLNFDHNVADYDLYLDDFLINEAVCEIGSCWVCEVYETCIPAGCMWYYSIYLLESYCVEPYEPDPDECGGLYKCQFCMTQETCEAEFCIWEDRFGLGEKCYIPEPEIPPSQEEWEVPDLEDCGELSGVELWLCEIKNFIAGIFMPSQEKVNSLFYTIGAFKERFPFNYAESLNRFFSEIGESLDEEKSIPIEILGQESEVSFAFWEKTTTIGGEEETFKNVLFDFTTLLVVLGATFWVISLIKRFF